MKPDPAAGCRGALDRTLYDGRGALGAADFEREP
jgi:hypothetical protein